MIVHEYGELLSFWRGDPTDGRLTLARANSRRASAGVDGKGQATVRDFDRPAEQWSTRRLDNVEENQGAQHRPTVDDPAEPPRHQDDGRDRRPPSAAGDHDSSEKSFVHSTLGWIDDSRQ